MGRRKERAGPTAGRWREGDRGDEEEKANMFLT
jgi:hypothetical protein